MSVTTNPHTGHKQDTLSYQGQRFSIDCKLIPALKAMWHRGIKTKECCQGSYQDGKGKLNNAYLVFPDSSDARTFHKMMSTWMGDDGYGYGYLDVVRGKWELRPKIGGCLTIIFEWCPSKTDLLVELVGDVTSSKATSNTIYEFHEERG